MPVSTVTTHVEGYCSCCFPYRELLDHLVLMAALVMLVTLVTKATQDLQAVMVITDLM